MSPSEPENKKLSRKNKDEVTGLEVQSLAVQLFTKRSVLSTRTLLFVNLSTPSP